MFAGSQLPSNKTFAAALLPASLPLGEGRTVCKKICLLCYSVAEAVHSLGTANINSKVWCRKGWTGTPILSESKNHVDFFPGIFEVPRERRG